MCTVEGVQGALLVRSHIDLLLTCSNRLCHLGISIGTIRPHVKLYNTPIAFLIDLNTFIQFKYGGIIGYVGIALACQPYVVYT